MKTSDIIDFIQGLDKSTPEFYQIYTAASNKYWNVDDPDELQQKAIALHYLAEQADWSTHAVATIAEHFFSIVEEGSGMIHFNFTIEDLPVFITMCTDPSDMDKAIKAIEQQIIGNTTRRKPGEEIH